jgi:hypothetical protein
MSASAPPKFTVQPHVVFAQLGDESILLNTTTGLYFGLDPIGTSIWMRLGEGADAEQIHAELLGEYDVDTDVLRTDLERLLGELRGRGLIAPSAALSSSAVLSN